MDAYNLSKKTQKNKITGSEIAAIGTLGALSLARALKDKDDVADDAMQHVFGGVDAGGDERQARVAGARARGGG